MHYNKILNNIPEVFNTQSLGGAKGQKTRHRYIYFVSFALYT
jgi:hypothetical protein